MLARVARAIPNKPSPEYLMLSTIAFILIILWLVGLVTATTLGGFIHVLLVIAIVVVLIRIISGRNPL